MFRESHGLSNASSKWLWLIVTFLFNKFFYKVPVFSYLCIFKMFKLHNYDQIRKFIYAQKRSLTQPLILHVTRLKYSEVHVISCYSEKTKFKASTNEAKLIQANKN
jgi:hypothetical protein